MDVLNEHDSVCPNCGTLLTGKYCHECGQQAALHDDTVVGLVGHFIAHEFHYESKFGQTIKALLFSPGKLTLAYISKIRAKYIAPISLYLFISAFFFLTASLVNGHKEESHATLHNERYMSFSRDGVQMNIDPGEKNNEDLAKVFFFIIPLLALLLRAIVWGKRFRYVHHVIFALHFHAFLFILFLLMFLYPDKWGALYFDLTMVLVSIVYLIVALHKVYAMKTVKAIAGGLFISVSYILLYFCCYAFYFTLLDKFSVNTA